jgi:hypothetical protein
MKCPKTSLKVQCAKCQGFGHSFVNSTSKPLVIQEYKDIDKKKKKDYYVQLYELNLEDFSGLEDEDVQKKGLNTIRPNEFENEVNEEYIEFILMIEEIFKKLLSGIA